LSLTSGRLWLRPCQVKPFRDGQEPFVASPHRRFAGDPGSDQEVSIDVPNAGPKKTVSRNEL
jgi:hypothetical protein